MSFGAVKPPQASGVPATPGLWTGPSYHHEHTPTPGEPPSGSPAPSGGAAGWWAAASSPTKIAVVLGAGVLLGGLAALLVKHLGHQKAARLTANRRRRLSSHKKKRKRSSGHASAPAKYRRLGATRAADYGYGAGYQYPLVFRTKAGKIKRAVTRKHIAAAARYFERYKGRYPAHVRKQIAKKINQAKERYGVGGQYVRP